MWHSNELSPLTVSIISHHTTRFTLCIYLKTETLSLRKSQAKDFVWKWKWHKKLTNTHSESVSQPCDSTAYRCHHIATWQISALLCHGASLTNNQMNVKLIISVTKIVIQGLPVSCFNSESSLLTLS